MSMQNSSPFRGLKILDVTRVLAGPFSTYQLGLLGADVLKIEDPLYRGDSSRYRGMGDRALSSAGMGASFLSANANKKSMLLDLRTPSGQDIFRKLASDADVVVENLRASAMKSYGLGYEDLQRLNPRIIYCSITGYGQLNSRAAYDPVVQAASGMMSITGTNITAPMRCGAPVIDYAAGLSAAFAIATALFERCSTGLGQQLDVSMLDAAVMLMGSIATNVLSTGAQPNAWGNCLGPLVPGNQLYSTSDGQIWISAVEPHQFDNLLRAIGLESLVEDPRFLTAEDRSQNWTELAREIELTLMMRPATEWEEVLNHAGVPAMRLRTVSEGLSLAHSLRPTLFHRFEKVDGVKGPVTVPLLPFRTSNGPGAVNLPPPGVGQHTEQVLRVLGYAQEAIEKLKADGVI